jgi:hypothetical protein
MPELILGVLSFHAHHALQMAAQAELASKEIRRSRRPHICSFSIISDNALVTIWLTKRLQKYVCGLIAGV